MKVLPIFTLFVLVAIIATQLVVASLGFSNCSRSFINGWIPGQPKDSAQVCRDGVIAISYSGHRKNANYAAYFVTPEDVADNIPGRDSFYADPDLEAAHIPQASRDAEVFGDTWNRGHLAPSRLMSWREDTKYATYSMANINPQYGYFNQHPWQYLETDVFEWIGENEDLYVVTGSGYDDIENPNFFDGVAIPTFYWKAICDRKNNQSAGFYGYNKKEDIEKHIQAKGRAGGAIESFLTVKELSERIYKSGEIFPSYYCNTDKVDESYWGWSTTSYGEETVGVNHILKNHAEPKRALKSLFHKHKEQFKHESRRKALKAKQMKQRQ